MSIHIHYYIHGNGRGHATRAIHIIETLKQEGYLISIFASGKAKEILPSQWQVQSVALSQSIYSFFKRLNQVYANDHVPQLIISDADAPSIVAARLMGIPVISLAHGTVYSRCLHGVKLPKWPVFKEGLKGLVDRFFATQSVVVHFLKATAKQANVSLARADLQPKKDTQTKKMILAYFLKGSDYGWLDLFNSRGYDICFCNQGNDPKTQLPRAEFLEKLNHCSAVVGTGGFNLISEALMAKKPILNLVSGDNPEQQLNAHLIEQHGLGLTGKLSRPSAAKVDQFLSKLSTFNTIELNTLYPPVSDVVLSKVKGFLKT